MRTPDPYALGGFLAAFLIAVLLGPRVIDALRVLKFGQNINEYLSEGHQKKQGTPSMGGVLLVLSLILKAPRRRKAWRGCPVRRCGRCPSR